MRTSVLRCSSLFVLPLITALAACGAAPGDELEGADPASGAVGPSPVEVSDPAVDAEEVSPPAASAVPAESDMQLATAPKGVWISTSELLALPMSGSAWDKVTSAANGLSGKADLSDNNSDHDVDTLAAAYVAVRTNDSAMRAKTIKNIETVYTSGYARVLEMSRNIQAYVIAADVIGSDGWDSDRFKKFVRALATKPLSGHSGGGNMLETAELSGNNWGCHSRAAISLIALYTQDSDLLAKVVPAQRAFLSGEGGRLKFTSTNWHTGVKAGINAPGSSISGHNVDGVIPEDQRRTGSFSWPAPKGSYPWEALQGTLVAGIVLHRSGWLPFDTGSNAIVRAAKWLTVVNGNPASGDDTWQPWLLNKFGGAGLSASSASPGKNMGFTDWTHR